MHTQSTYFSETNAENHIQFGATLTQHIKGMTNSPVSLNVQKGILVI